MKLYGEEINYNLNTDKIIKAIDEPTYMTDRKREELRITAEGTYYLHTNNDRENELIITSGFEIDQWMEKHGVNEPEIRKQITAAIDAGNYRVEFESGCGCGIDWEINSQGELISVIDNDACWIGTVLYIGDEAIAQNIAYEPFESLVDGMDADEIVEMFDECEKDIWQEMSFDEAQQNPDHQNKLMDSLAEFIKDNEYYCYVRYPRNFANEYTCILAEEGSEVNAEAITVSEFVEKYLQTDTDVTKYYIGFEFVRRPNPWYVLDYQNGNRAIMTKEEYEAENGISDEYDEAIAAIIEIDKKPSWEDLVYDDETRTYRLK